MNILLDSIQSLKNIDTTCMTILKNSSQLWAKSRFELQIG